MGAEPKGLLGLVIYDLYLNLIKKKKNVGTLLKELHWTKRSKSLQITKLLFYHHQNRTLWFSYKIWKPIGSTLIIE